MSQVEVTNRAFAAQRKLKQLEDPGNLDALEGNVGASTAQIVSAIEAVLDEVRKPRVGDRIKGMLARAGRSVAGLPDPDGMIASALKDFDAKGYEPHGEVAAVATQKDPNLRGLIIRKASFITPTDDSPPAGLAFTDYDLRLPGEDKIWGNEDDLVRRDGMIMKQGDVAKGGVGRSVSGVLNP